ncbi:MAG: hypothetical protein Q8Q01_03915 [archaeon]|nr:hypothetical protein [archaeon]
MTEKSTDDHILVEKALKEEFHTESQEELEKSIKEDSKLTKKDARNIGIAVLIIIGVFVLLLGNLDTKDTDSSNKLVKSVNELHMENLDGKLSGDRGYMYNGYSFVKYDGLWWTILKVFGKGIQVPLHFGPQEVADIPISGSLTDAFNNGEEVHIGIDPKVTNKYYTLSISELSFNVASGVQRLPVGSCTEEDEACIGRPIISCENNPENKPIIELILGGEPKVTLDGACVKIQGSEYDLVKAVDRFLLRWYTIMP